MGEVAKLNPTPAELAELGYVGRFMGVTRKEELSRRAMFEEMGPRNLSLSDDERQRFDHAIRMCRDGVEAAGEAVSRMGYMSGGLSDIDLGDLYTTPDRFYDRSGEYVVQTRNHRDVMAGTIFPDGRDEIDFGAAWDVASKNSITFRRQFALGQMRDGNPNSGVWSCESDLIRADIRTVGVCLLGHDLDAVMEGGLDRGAKFEGLHLVRWTDGLEPRILSEFAGDGEHQEAFLVGTLSVYRTLELVSDGPDDEKFAPRIEAEGTWFDSVGSQLDI